MPPMLLAARGTVVNLGSVTEVFCPPFFAAYNASKAAVECLSKPSGRNWLASESKW